MNMLDKARLALAPLTASPFRTLAVAAFLGVGVARWAGWLPGGTASSDLAGLWSVILTILEIVGG